ncbi:DUF2309 domain-containing protein [Acuticoccus sp. MNP-M23]|uniref:YbcC family protein n=1 Tax=Acuticoccus sp. MNP-M23 TaxID=3072793 RepID=UPI00281673DB|nr:DUF2309 domain-containing protein [Acuticoccus sp. MNP-M23]WMS43952.1 DUF2309 domain-containing protein [Acuticoccus sp. MNP-M23]
MTHAPLQSSIVLAAADAAVRAVPPLWPLATSVAVNPYLGQTGEPLATTSARLARVAGARTTMPRDWYAGEIASGQISDADLAAAIDASGTPGHTAGTLKEAAGRAKPAALRLPTVADLAATATGTDWPDIVAERVGAFASSQLDDGQALWAAPRSEGLYRTWKAGAVHDLTPEIAGLTGFARFAASAPATASGAIERAADTLCLSEAALDTYFHALLMTLGGWSQFARYRLWQAELAGEDDTTALDFLAIRLLWEEALFCHCEDAIGDTWRDTVAAHAVPVAPGADDEIDAILQAAAEHAEQRSLAGVLAAPAEAAPARRPALQAAFCIDVRSEVFRRSLETVAPTIQTLGFAGFFGISTSYHAFASDVAERRLPVLLNPALQSRAGPSDQRAADPSARFVARAKRAWGRFKLAAVSSFAFVEAMGPVYVTRLVRDALGLGGRPTPADPAPVLSTRLGTAEMVTAAASVLRAMSLTENFAPVVLLAGHGARVVNNPHASALQCGACGGYSGEVNARLLASLLNNPEVRAGLAKDGITIPADTLFLGALHDTTTDAVTLYAGDTDTSRHTAALAETKRWLEAAGALARAERALRLPGAEDGGAVLRRGSDWAQTRPEWALAGCTAFIAAPRDRTSGKSLQGKAFLHDYDWQRDKGFSVLELILTAPVVVASWINLQYYGSTVAPDVFGSGNKLIHNVTGGIGVVEGNGGTLRAGLPFQSVHNGEAFVHAPLRLSVAIEAPREAINEILSRHDGVRALFDNGWLHLFALDDRGRMAWRYAGDLDWTPNTLAQTDQPETLRVA